MSVQRLEVETELSGFQILVLLMKYEETCSWQRLVPRTGNSYSVFVPEEQVPGTVSVSDTVAGVGFLPLWAHSRG